MNFRCKHVGNLPPVGAAGRPSAHGRDRSLHMADADRGHGPLLQRHKRKELEGNSL